MTNTFEKITGIGNEHNNFDEGSSILKTAAYRVFAATTSPEETPYELSPQDISKKSLGWGILQGHTPIKGNPLTKLLFGLGSIVAAIFKIPEFILYSISLGFQNLSKYSEVYLAPAYLFAGLKMLASVASPLSNTMRTIKAGHPRKAFAVLILSGIAISMLVFGLLIPTFLPALIPLLESHFLFMNHGVPLIAAWGLTTILPIMILTKGFPTGLIKKIRKGTVQEGKKTAETSKDAETPAISQQPQRMQVKGASFEDMHTKLGIATPRPVDSKTSTPTDSPAQSQASSEASTTDPDSPSAQSDSEDSFTETGPSYSTP